MESTKPAIESCLVWPDPISVQDRLPEPTDPSDPDYPGQTNYVLAFQRNSEQWGEASYDHTTGLWTFADDWHNCRQEWITHWLPMPPRVPDIRDEFA